LKEFGRMYWEPHGIAKLFRPMTSEERAALKKDMVDRLKNGLEPLEHPVVLYEDKILDGRHRAEIWRELDEEGTCGGYFKRMQPPTERFSPSKHGTLGAWLRAKSANMVGRGLSADERAATFLKAVDEYPELKAVIDEITQENAKRQLEGKPLDASVQRGNTAEQIGKLADVGPTTMKQVQRLKKEAPEKFEEVAAGKTTAKKALKRMKKEKAAGSGKDKKRTAASEQQQRKKGRGGEPKRVPEPKPTQTEDNWNLTIQVMGILRTLGMTKEQIETALHDGTMQLNIQVEVTLRGQAQADLIEVDYRDIRLEEDDD
jgi:hypothetical protein